MTTATLIPLQQPVQDAQQLFRGLLRAMSEPGRIVTWNHTPVDNPSDITGLWLVAQCVLDAEVKAHCTLNNADHQATFLEACRFHTGVQIVDDMTQADFVFTDLDGMLHASSASIGTLEAPHTSATVVVHVPTLSDKADSKPAFTLSGPGVKGTRDCHIEQFTSSHLDMIQNNHQHFPCGVDWIFVCESNVLCIPRSTQVASLQGED